MFPPPFVAPSALAICALLALGGCSQQLTDVTGSIGAPRRAELPTDEAQLRRFAEDWGHRYDADPKNKPIALTYAKALHALDRNAQAVAVLQGLAIRYPEDLSVLAAYGKALADAGRLREAADVLSRAHYAGAPGLDRIVGAGIDRRPARQSPGSARILPSRAEDRAQ